MSHFDVGRRIRGDVLGEEHVRALLDGADDFNRPFQEFLTEYCWGRAWGDEGLSRKQRSLLNIGMIAALNRAAEFKLHVRAAIRNGVTLRELRAALIQVAVYCGIPAGVEGFRIANTVIEELRESGELAE